MSTDPRIVKCRSCGADMIFLRNPKTGSKVPCNASSVLATDQSYIASFHVSHFTTCPNASKHSKKRSS